MKYLKRFSQHTEYQDIYGWWGGGAVLPNVSVCDDDEVGTVHYNPKWVLEDVFVTDWLDLGLPGFTSTGADREQYSKLLETVEIPEGYSLIGICIRAKNYPSELIVRLEQKWHCIMHLKYLDNGETEYIDINTFGQKDVTASMGETYIADNYPSNYEEYNYEKYMFEVNINGETIKDCFCIKTDRPYALDGFDHDVEKKEQEVQFCCLNKEQHPGGRIPAPYSIDYESYWIFGKWKKIE